MQRIEQAENSGIGISCFHQNEKAGAISLLDSEAVLMGLITDPVQFDFVMGVPGGLGADPAHLVHMVRCLPPGSTWSVAGIGRHQLTLAIIALAMGGNARVGFEDNIYYRKGELARSNAQLVARIARIALELDRPVATPAQAREMLQLNRYKQ